MYKIATVLRNKQSPNIYRRVLLEAFTKAVGGEYLLCSGFFQEKKYTVTSYYASTSFIANPHPLSCSVTLTTVGVYDKKIWGHQYDDFVKALSTIKCSCGAQMSIKKRAPKKGNKWHAKIFIVKKDGYPQLAIIGSSNITKNAFDELKGWNRECDVYIWNTLDTNVNSIIRVALTTEVSRPEDGERRNEVIVSSYDAEDPLNTRSTSMDQRLNDLWDAVLAETDEV